MTLTMETVLTFQAFIVILVSVIAYWIKKHISDNDSRHNENEKKIEKNGNEIKEIKENYLERFGGIAEKVNATEQKLIERIHSTEIKIIEEISKLRK